MQPQIATPHTSQAYAELPAVERRGAWFHLRYRPLDGFKGYRALRGWLGLAGFHTRDYHGLALEATISKHQDLAAVFVDPYNIWLTDSLHADHLAEQLSALEVSE